MGSAQSQKSSQKAKEQVHYQKMKSSSKLGNKMKLSRNQEILCYSKLGQGSTTGAG